MEMLPYRSVAITGSSGYIGGQVLAALAKDRRRVERVLAIDVRPPGAGQRVDGVDYVADDVRTADFAALFRRHAVDAVVHLAAIVSPGRGMTRDFEYAVDVTGTENVLKGCAAAKVRKLVYTSSGAAYGYHADSPAALGEDDALRGNPEFAYSDHKRLVEEMLARWRSSHPGLAQLVLRPCTILGASTHNQITDMFDRPVLLGILGASTPFVFVWDEDVVGAILHGLHNGGEGVFNLAGDGTLTMAEVARLLGKPFLAVPAFVVAGALAVLKRFGLSQYGPEQVNFLRYRPVLSNHRLKRDFGYVPRKTTREAFDVFLKGRRERAAS